MGTAKDAGKRNGKANGSNGTGTAIEHVPEIEDTTGTSKRYQWHELEKRWLAASHIDLERFALENDIQYQTLRNRSSMRKKRFGQTWVEWKRDILTAAQGEADRIVANRIAIDIAAMNEKHFKAAEMSIAAAARILKKGMKEDGSITLSAKDLRSVTAALKDAQAMQRTSKELPADRLGVAHSMDETYVATIESGGMPRVRQATSIEGHGQEPFLAEP